MREIKFRAWDKENKKMYSVVGLAHPTETGFDTVAITDHHDIETWLEGDEYELMQYTGLKDKNGKEIYEGDILGKRPYGYLKADGTKDNRYRGRDWTCFAVEWGEYDASEAGLVSGYEFETDGKYAGWNIVIGGYDDDLSRNEVIGNIYENPELVK